MRFKVGDIVTIDSFENIKNKGVYDKQLDYVEFIDQRIVFNRNMKKYCGKTVVIDSCDDHTGFYHISGWLWIDLMFKEVSNTKPKFEFVDLNIEF